MQARLVRVEPLMGTTTDTISSFYFAPEQPLEYLAGQYAEFTLQHPKADTRGKRRWFTLSSSPSEPLLRITVRRTLRAGSSFKQALWQMQPGDTLQVSQAQGDFVLPLDSTRPVQMVALGLGITPYMSMLDWLAYTYSGEPYTINILYKPKHRAEELGSFMPALPDTIPYTTLPPASRLTAKQLIASAGSSSDILLYLAGPEPVVEQLQQDLIAAGHPSYNIVTDAFLGYS
jgi:ferredoxin-NADP reductase